MPDNGKIEELTDNLKSYINTNLELIKYQAIERSTVIIADMLSTLLVGLFLLFFLQDRLILEQNYHCETN